MKVLWVGALATFEVDTMCARRYDRVRVRTIHVAAGRRVYASGSRRYLLKQKHEKLYSMSVMPLQTERLRGLVTMQELREDVLALHFSLVIACLSTVRCHGACLSCGRRTRAGALIQKTSRAWVKLTCRVETSWFRCACKMSGAR